MKLEFLFRQMYHERMMGYTYEPNFVCITCDLDLNKPKVRKIFTDKKMPIPVNYFGFIEFIPTQGVKRLNKIFGWHPYEYKKL